MWTIPYGQISRCLCLFIIVGPKRLVCLHSTSTGCGQQIGKAQSAKPISWSGGRTDRQTAWRPRNPGCIISFRRAMTPISTWFMFQLPTSLIYGAKAIVTFYQSIRGAFLSPNDPLGNWYQHCCGFSLSAVQLSKWFFFSISFRLSRHVFRKNRRPNASPIKRHQTAVSRNEPIEYKQFAVHLLATWKLKVLVSDRLSTTSPKCNLQKSQRLSVSLMEAKTKADGKNYLSEPLSLSLEIRKRLMVSRASGIAYTDTDCMFIITKPNWVLSRSTSRANLLPRPLLHPIPLLVPAG